MEVKCKFKRYIIFFIALAMVFFSFGGAEAKISSKDEKVKVLPLNGESKEGIFNLKDGLWYPGREEVRGFYVDNNYKEDIQVEKINFQTISLLSLEEQRIIATEDTIYKDFMKNVNISLLCDGKILYEGTFEKLMEKGEINLNEKVTVKGNTKKNMQLVFAISPKAENNLQGVVNEFKLGITYTMDEAMAIIPQTGGFLNTTLLIFTGICLVICGIFLNRKKRENASFKQGGRLDD
ncbi:LPXTG cell wall anchor domain-containing protein [Clostridium sp. KNHs214]|uniref:LPXTG cell wall anchor domain-containing protein n=1 Tax=Clostridium sp. KNHs214 TaxID=1540257 RepID=UPI00055911BE|nr:LPXTG cell wall anchor domain-containing protein [Clostridium sp. KNHs214]